MVSFFLRIIEIALNRNNCFAQGERNSRINFTSRNYRGINHKPVVINVSRLLFRLFRARAPASNAGKDEPVYPGAIRGRKNLILE